MNRRDLVSNLADRLDTDKRTADAHLQAVIDAITETVSKGEAVVISGFAKFARVDRAARMGRNPQTGEAIRIKASRRARVTPLKAFKDAILSGRTPAKKTAAKKTTAKKTAPVKKTVAKKTVAKKTVAKKTVAKKTTPVKKTAAKKTAAKKTAVRKTARR
jgi:DNA-binding protein HU-beta